MWRYLIGAIIGAVLVEESPAIKRAYQAGRDGLRKSFEEQAQEDEDPPEIDAP